MELDEQPPPPQAQPKDDRASRSPSPPAEIEEQQHEDPPQVGLRLGDHILGPTPAQEEPEEHGQDFTIAAEEEEAVVEVNAEGADDEGAEEGLQALDADVESGAEDAVEVREFDGEEMVVDGVGEDSGFFPAEDEQEEGVVAQEQPKHALAVPVELVPNTSSLPQPSFEKPIRAQPALKVNPVIQPSPQLKKTSNLLPRLSPLIAKTNPPRPPRISLLANQANRNRPAVFSSPRPAPKALVPPRPPRRASSEPPSGRREGGEGSPRARARSHGRHSEPEPKRMKEKQGRGKSKTRSRESAGRSKGKERERAVHADEEETVGDGYEQDFAQELRAQLDEMVDVSSSFSLSYVARL
ncbi:hypothetical protein BCR35DRAFT_25689 [Leucosporidium creatinivorum]|uniref:Uncharacterized protein n=1 Tax=Leucosporidium creatinivorum TaxID=106004 RepID=A0A1Y2CRR5_9BASI|nr:hypothetical protein BCR35DRAFT_25689 [Leucosporidium creatinivorum]